MRRPDYASADRAWNTYFYTAGAAPQGSTWIEEGEDGVEVWTGIATTCRRVEKRSAFNHLELLGAVSGVPRGG